MNMLRYLKTSKSIEKVISSYNIYLKEIILKLK